MCGIVYSRSLVGKPVSRTIIKRYEKQRGRGHEGFGFYTPETNTLTHNVREGRILSLLRRNKKASEILFHHRMPTSTANVRNACHPFSTKKFFKHNYIGVHNGVLWNEHSLRPVHEARGIKYISEQPDGSFNDSEALVYDLARYIEGEVGFITAKGTIAFIVVQRDKKGKSKAVYFGRNTGNPLVMKQTEKTLTLSSEGEGVLIDPDILYRFDYETGTLTRSPCLFPSYSHTPGYFGTGYWMGGIWHEDDDLEIPEWNGGNPSPVETRRYFESEFNQERQAHVQQEYERLKREARGDLEMARDIGLCELEGLEKIESDLRDRVEVQNISDDEEVERFYQIGDRIYYISRAIEKLESEGSGSRQTNFHHSFPTKQELIPYRSEPFSG